MCEPTTIAMGASLAGGIASRYQQEKRFEAATDSATRQARTNQARVNTRIGQERVSAAYRADAMSLEANKVRGQVAASAAAGGVQGMSVRELAGEVTQREVQNQMALATSLGFSEDQAEAEKLAIGQQASATAAQFMPTTSYAGSIFSAAGVGASLYLRGATEEVKNS